MHADSVIFGFIYLDLDETTLTTGVATRPDVEFKPWVAVGKADAVPFGGATVVCKLDDAEDEMTTAEVGAWLNVTFKLEGIEERLDTELLDKELLDKELLDKELLERAVLESVDGDSDEDGALIMVFSV